MLLVIVLLMRYFGLLYVYKGIILFNKLQENKTVVNNVKINK